MAKTTGDVIVEKLLDWGVDTAFGIPGDGIKLSTVAKSETSRLATGTATRFNEWFNHRSSAFRSGTSC